MQHFLFKHSQLQFYINRGNSRTPSLRTMKYILLLFVCVAAILSVTAKIPDYIHICTRNDPDISQCILNSIVELKPKLIAGLSEFGVPPIDPLFIDKLSMNLGPGFQAEATNLEIRGAGSFVINKIKSDPFKNTYYFDLSLAEAIVDGSYAVDAKLGSIPLKGEGPMRIHSTSLVGEGTLLGKTVKRGGKTHIWFPSMNLKVQVGDYKIKLDNLFKGDPTIGEVTNRLLNEEKEEVMKSLIPALEKTASQLILAYANNITKHFTWDELFPETLPN